MGHDHDIMQCVDTAYHQVGLYNTLPKYICCVSDKKLTIRFRVGALRTFIRTDAGVLLDCANVSAPPPPKTILKNRFKKKIVGV